MPAPPPDLTAASGAMVMDGGTSRRALTTAMLDLASRGLIAFREDPGGLLGGRKVGIDVRPAPGDAEEAQRARNARRPIGPAEEYALRQLPELGADDKEGFISADDLPKFGPKVSTFDLKRSRPMSSSAAGSRRSRARSSPAGPGAGSWRSSRASSRSSPG